MAQVIATPPADNLVRTCSIWRALEDIGDAPALLILEAIWMGASRFGELQNQTGLLKALLSDRLKRLSEKQIIIKRPLMDAPKSHHYVLTHKGVELFPVVLMLYRWERAWGFDPSRRQLQIKHETCGHVLEPKTVCESTGEEFTLDDIAWQPGPGVGWMAPHYSRRRNQQTIQSERPSLLKGSVEILGDRWAALVMRAVFTGIRRFDGIQADTGAVPNTLSDRLKSLTELGVIEARPYQHTPVRHEYFLTRKGYDYYYIIMMLMLWGDAFYGSPEGSPVLLTHKATGKPLKPIVVCGFCGERVRPQDVSILSQE